MFSEEIIRSNSSNIVVEVSRGRVEMIELNSKKLSRLNIVAV